MQSPPAFALFWLYFIFFLPNPFKCFLAFLVPSPPTHTRNVKETRVTCSHLSMTPPHPLNDVIVMGVNAFGSVRRFVIGGATSSQSHEFLIPPPPQCDTVGYHFLSFLFCLSPPPHVTKSMFFSMKYSHLPKYGLCSNSFSGAWRNLGKEFMPNWRGVGVIFRKVAGCCFERKEWVVAANSAAARPNQI